MKKILKRIGLALGAIVAVIVLAVLGLYLAGSLKIHKVYDLQVQALSIPGDAAAIERGRHLAEAIGPCSQCHGVKLEGKLVADAGPVGVFIAPNLTSGKDGLGATFSDADWVRALRLGIGPNGESLRVMPSKRFTHLTDADLGALIAFLKSVPPVDNNPGAFKMGPLFFILTGAGQLQELQAPLIEGAADYPAPPAAGPTAEYGYYLVTIADCQDCHGENLGGRPLGSQGPPPGPNLTKGGEVAAWSEADFARTLRSGLTPSGHQLKDEMPWRSFGQMTDEELQAIWAYLQTVPPVKPKS